MSSTFVAQGFHIVHRSQYNKDTNGNNELFEEQDFCLVLTENSG